MKKNVGPTGNASKLIAVESIACGRDQLQSYCWCEHTDKPNEYHSLKVMTLASETGIGDNRPDASKRRLVFGGNQTMDIDHRQNTDDGGVLSLSLGYDSAGKRIAGVPNSVEVDQRFGQHGHSR